MVERLDVVRLKKPQKNWPAGTEATVVYLLAKNAVVEIPLGRKFDFARDTLDVPYRDLETIWPPPLR